MFTRAALAAISTGQVLIQHHNHSLLWVAVQELNMGVAQMAAPPVLTLLDPTAIVKLFVYKSDKQNII